MHDDINKFKRTVCKWVTFSQLMIPTTDSIMNTAKIPSHKNFLLFFFLAPNSKPWSDTNIFNYCVQ